MRKNTTETNPLIIEQAINEISSLKTGEEFYFFLRNRLEKGYTATLLAKVMKRARLPNIGLIPMLHEPKSTNFVPFKWNENADIYNVVEAMLPIKEGDEMERVFLNGVWVHDRTVTACNGFSLLQVKNIRYSPEHPEFWKNSEGPTMCPPEMPKWEQVIPAEQGQQFVGIFNTSRLTDLLGECYRLTKGPIAKSAKSIPMRFDNSVFISTEILARVMRTVARLAENVIIRCNPDENGRPGPMVITNASMSEHPPLFTAVVMPMRYDDEYPHFAAPSTSSY